MQKVSLTNGEKVIGCAVTIFDEKGKPFATPPSGVTVSWSPSAGGETIAQLSQDGGLDFDVTTEGDDIGVVTFTADIRDASGKQLLDADGAQPQLEVTVTNSAPGIASVSVGTIQPE